MVKGLSPSSAQIEISFDSLATAGSYTQKRIDLQLNPLDREVFVVTAVKLDIDMTGNLPLNLFGAAGAGNNNIYGARVALTKNTRETVISNLGESTCFATANHFIGTAEESQANGDYAVAYSGQENSADTPSALDYISILATNDFFVGMQAYNDSINTRVYGKLYGFRASASSDIYAALVQSEVLSN